MAPSVSSIIPYAHVRDVGRSVDFYRLLGLSVLESVERDGRLVWAWLGSGTASLMLAAADAPVDEHSQGVLFYLHVVDVEGLRRDLVAAGSTPGPITRPEHMPSGEFRLRDPDGYVLLLGQVES